MTNLPKKKLKFVFYSFDATGHMNSAIGMAQALQDRGHEIIFAMNSLISQKYQKYGFKIVDMNYNVPETETDCSDNPAKKYAKYLKDTGVLSNRPPIEQMKAWMDVSETSILGKFLRQSIEFHPQIEAIIESEKPDAFIMDHFFYQPCFDKFNLPWITLMSVAPAFLYEGPDHPPALSGYTVNERSKWNDFSKELDKIPEAYDKCQNNFNEYFNFKANGQYKRHLFYNVSPYLNIYQYPKELDYTECTPIVPNIIAVDAFIREDKEEFQIPEKIKPNREAGERLIFLSKGSMGGFNVELMNRLVKTLSKSKHKIIVSKGPLGDELKLSDNMWGENFVPQIQILPLVDLVITHGGNNSTTESFYFGKPVIVMPLFADQYDNAQRIQDKQYGIRLGPYDHKESDLHEAIEKLLTDEQLKIRLEKAKQRIQNSNSKQKACEKIEEMLS